MIKTIIFDWDGTLHDTKILYGSAFRKGYSWLVENGYAEEHFYTDEEAGVYIGYSAGEMWEIFRPDLPKEVTDIPSEIVGRAMFEDISGGKARLYDGALDVLSELKEEGYKLVFLSKCHIFYMEAHRKYFDLDKYFDGMYNCEEFGWASKPEVFNTIKKDFPGEYIMVGDRAGDLEVGFTYNFPTIGCVYGFGFEGELDGADLKAENVKELPSLIKEIAGRYL